MGDALGGAFENIGADIVNSVWSAMVQWFYESIYTAVGEFFAEINSLGVEIFDLSWVQAVVQLFTLLGWSLFVVGVAVAVFEVAIESQSGRVNIKGTALNILKGFFAASLSGTLPVQRYKFCCSLQSTFTGDLAGVFAGAHSSSLGDLAAAILRSVFFMDATVVVGLKLIFFLLAFAYCIIKIFFANIKRGGIMLVQIAVGSLYLFSVPRGYTDGYFQWCKQVFAICLIFDRYLLGDSLRDIKEYLEINGIPAPDGGSTWDTSRISGILKNEKYAGDVLRQKTFKADMMSGKTVKNTGQLPMYLIENNHPTIIPREQFNAVQAERLRRSAGRSPSKKNASTGRTSYASKYALSERLVCGECGTLYRRCTWKRNGKVRIVWRCVSRLDYGTKYCKESPTMDEEPLQQAIMEAINSTMTSKAELTENIMSAMTEEVIRLPNGGMTLAEIQSRREELNAEFATLLAQTNENGTSPYMERFREIAEETAKLKAQQEQIAGQLRKNTAAQEKLHIVHSALEAVDHRLTQWDEEMIRQLVHTVKVVSKDCIRVYLTDGTEIEQTVAEK